MNSIVSLNACFTVIVSPWENTFKFKKNLRGGKLGGSGIKYWTVVSSPLANSGYS